MRKVFMGLAAVLMFAVVVQFFLAGSGAFDSAPNDEAFRPHRALGFVLVLLAVVLTVTAAVARLPGRLIGLSGLVTGLMLVQPVIAVAAKAFGEGDDTTAAGQLVFGLHAVNALVIMSVLRNILREVRAQTAAPHETSAMSTAGSVPSAP